MNQPFEPTRAAALSRIDALDLVRYARTRTALDGRISLLSPYLTRGVVTIGAVTSRIRQRAKLGWNGKFAFELGWCEYFQHALQLLGATIWLTQHPAPAPQYSGTMPSDVSNAATGIKIIDESIGALMLILFVDPSTRQRSFSSFWHRAMKEEFPA